MAERYDFHVDFVEREIFTAKFNVIDFIHGGNSLSTLSDVDLSGLQDKDYLIYDNTIHRWIPISLSAIIQNNLILNELPTQINAVRFQTQYNFISGTLQVFLNGIKERYITVISANQFELPISFIADDLVEVSYIRQ